jgi:hypothetical protein
MLIFFFKLEFVLKSAKKLQLFVVLKHVWQSCSSGKPSLPLVQKIRVKHAKRDYDAMQGEVLIARLNSKENIGQSPMDIERGKKT